MNHDELQSLLGVYALDALDPDEAAEVEAHLADCPRCRSEVAAHRQTASLLATVGGEAPPQLWDRIAAELAPDAEEHLPPLHAMPPPAAPEAAPRATSPAAASPKVVPLGSARRRRTAMSVIAAVATAAAAAAAVLGVTASHLNHRVDNLSHAVAAGGLQQAAAAAVLNPQHRSVQLASAISGGSHSTAQVVILPDGNAFWIKSDLPALDTVQTYQVWGLTNGKVVSLGLLGASAQLGAFRVEPGTSRLMVTAEPKGGVPAPTTPVLVQGNIPA